MTANLEQAINALREGRFVLIFDSDSREAETDMVIASEKMTYEAVRTMRKDAGGLICTTAPAETWQKLDLPYLAELFVEAYQKHPGLKLLAPNDLPYDTKSAFGITLNHRHTFTGIPDNDRALTISEFAKLGQRIKDMTAEEAKKALGKDFRSPGHVILLNSQPGMLDARKGHTELSSALLTMAGMYPSATVCEMLGEDGKALRKEKAQEYAKRSGIVYLDGAEIIDAWKANKWSP